MGTAKDYNGGNLTPAACWALLRSAQTGRLAVTVDSEPDIFPINFVVDHGTVVFRTAPGTKMAAALSGRIAFEADGIDPEANQAWSVVIKGRAEEVKRLYDLLDTTTLPLYPLHVSPKNHHLRILVEQISGRRFSIADRASWYMPLVDAPRSAPE